MHTLAALQKGELLGLKELRLSENLTEFPEAIFTLSETLEVLDLSHNALSTLPDLSRLTKLRIAFFSFNHFTALPHAFKDCHNLTMLGFKANVIEVVDENILPLGMEWLILTDNRIAALPRSIGKLTKLRKFPLAGNQLVSLPEEMAGCRSLELIRLSANKLETIPEWLLHLPKLSWLAFSGNPCAKPPRVEAEVIAHSSLAMGTLLGTGASAQIYKAYAETLDKEVALKLFKGAVTSDGYAEDEMNAYLYSDAHPNLIGVHGRLEGGETLGLVLELIDHSYESLGNPPSFATCTRDTFDKETLFTLEEITFVAQQILSAIKHLHHQGIMHGDLYAHNILLNREKEHTYLGDFGAASFYDKREKGYEKIEVRAFGCLLEDLLEHCEEQHGAHYQRVHALVKQCMQEEVSQRPSFNEIMI